MVHGRIGSIPRRLAHDPAKAAAGHGIELVVVKHTEPKKGFVLLPRRWVVERTFAWLVKYRRLGKDHEFTTESSEAMIYAAMTHRMLRLLHPADEF